MVEICTALYHDPARVHANYLHATMIPTLMIQANIPEIRKTEEVILNIYCSILDKLFIENAIVPLLENHGCGLNIITDIADSGAPKIKQIMASLHDQMIRSLQNNSKIIFSSPDFVWSSGLAESLKKVQKGQCLVCPTIRIKSSSITYVKDFISMPHTNSEFSKLFIDVVPHKLIELSKEKPWDYERLEKTNTGYVFYHQEPPPVIFWPDERGKEAIDLAGLPGAYLPTFDHIFTQKLFEKGLILIPETNKEVFIGEFTPDKTYQNMIENKYDSPFARHCRSNGVMHDY